MRIVGRIIQGLGTGVTIDVEIRDFISQLSPQVKQVLWEELGKNFKVKQGNPSCVCGQRWENHDPNECRRTLRGRYEEKITKAIFEEHFREDKPKLKIEPLPPRLMDHVVSIQEAVAIYDKLSELIAIQNEVK